MEDCLEGKEEAEEDNAAKAPDKVRAKALLEILRMCGMGLDKQDMTKVSRLVGFIIGASSKSLRNQLTKDRGLILNEKTHRKHVDEVNKILTEMKSKIYLDCE